MSRELSVTTGSEARLFRGVPDSMATAPDDNGEDPLEQTELVRRLRRMEWPPAPVEVKERVLKRIVGPGGTDSEGHDTAPPESPDKN
jgi:hypothetical protein